MKAESETEAGLRARFIPLPWWMAQAETGAQRGIRQLPFGDLEGLVAKGCLHSMLLMWSVSWSDRQPDSVCLHLPKRLVLSFPIHFSYLISAEGQDRNETPLIIAARVLGTPGNVQANPFTFSL